MHSFRDIPDKHWYLDTEYIAIFEQMLLCCYYKTCVSHRDHLRTFYDLLTIIMSAFVSFLFTKQYTSIFLGLFGTSPKLCSNKILLYIVKIIRLC